MGHITINMSGFGSLSVSCSSAYIFSSYPGSSISASPDLQAEVVTSLTAMGKCLMVCPQMAISAGYTQVCYGIALVLSNSSKKFKDEFQPGVCTTLSLPWFIETNIRQKCEPGKLSWVESAPELQAGVRGLDPRPG